jgi:hypothetical protein
MPRIGRASRGIASTSASGGATMDFHDGANWTEMDVESPKPRLEPGSDVGSQKA